MINLLPPEEKERIVLERKKRIGLILWFLLLFFLVCLILVLLSLRTYLRVQVEFQKEILAKNQQEMETARIQQLQEQINSFNSDLARLDQFYQKKIYFSEILEKVSKILPQKAYLTDFSLSLSNERTIKVSLSGFSPDTATLLKFKENLEREPAFQKINFPASNWVEPANIDFFVTFEIPTKL